MLYWYDFSTRNFIWWGPDKNEILLKGEICYETRDQGITFLCNSISDCVLYIRKCFFVAEAYKKEIKEEVSTNTVVDAANETVAAALGCFSGVLIAALLAQVAANIGGISTFQMDEAEALLLL